MTQPTTLVFGGVKVRNDKDINKTLFCELCQLLLLNPIQLICCGTRLCRWCSKTGISNAVPFICPFCFNELPEKQARADRGAERELNSTAVECYSCSWTGSYKDYQQHSQQHHADLECTDCHAHFSTTNAFEEHRHELCDYRCIPCGLPGCSDLIKWSEMKNHYLQETHQRRLADFVATYFATKNRSSTVSGSSHNHANTTNAEWISVRQSIDIVESGSEILSSEFIRLRNECDQVKANYDQLISQKNELDKTGEKNCEKVNESVQWQNGLDEEVDKTKKLYSLTETVLLGPDDAIILRFHTQRDDINASFSSSSPTFKTSPYGYAFRLRICSTATSGSEDQDYLSIFIRLLSSEYDAILFYPFLYDISLCLCDQSGQGRDIISTITPDLNSAAFARPADDMNSEVGVSKFCPLSYLTDVQSIYLRDGVLFIRISVNFMNIRLSPAL